MNGVVLLERSKCRTNPASMISIRAVIDVLMENLNSNNKDDNININQSIIPLLHFDPLVLFLLSDYSFSRRSEDPIVDAFDPLSANCLDFCFLVYIFSLADLARNLLLWMIFYILYLYLFFCATTFQYLKKVAQSQVLYNLYLGKFSLNPQIWLKYGSVLLIIYQ